ncbi:unnamed protein product [Meloidogyne enterolobii]|uniref:Uncharacterized protein n=1 Tax=Meloidogyne enterolobii TaxID=390850 RepID=A0ACB0ZCD0_MELEN
MSRMLGCAVIDVGMPAGKAASVWILWKRSVICSLTGDCRKCSLARLFHRLCR